MRSSLFYFIFIDRNEVVYGHHIGCVPSLYIDGDIKLNINIHAIGVINNLFNQY